MGITAEYNETAGRVVIDENEGHPGIKATTLSYGQINDEMLAMLDKPRPSYYLLLLGFLMALGVGAVSLAIQVDVGIGYSGIGHCSRFLHRSELLNSVRLSLKPSKNLAAKDSMMDAVCPASQASHHLFVHNSRL